MVTGTTSRFVKTLLTKTPRFVSQRVGSGLRLEGAHLGLTNSSVHKNVAEAVANKRFGSTTSGYTPPENQVEYSQLLERYKEEIKLWKQFVEAKDESFNKLSKEKDERIKEKDESFNKLIKEKDESFNKLIKEKDESFNKLSKEKDERIKEKDKTIDSLDGKIAELTKEKMDQVARISVVFDNRLLLEIGLRELFPKEKSMTARYQKFVKSYLKSRDGKHLSDEARAAFKALGIQEDERTIFHTCEGLYQSLSLPFHTKIPDISGTGYMVGDEHPFVAVCIVILQNHGKIRDVVAFADRSFRTIKVCVEGKVLAPEEWGKIKQQ